MEIENFFTWFSSVNEFAGKSWLILGKGPSYSKLNQFDTQLYKKVSLNHVIREQVVDIAHIIDFDVAVDCAEQIYENAQFLVMPWRPHIDNWVSIRTLEQLLKEHKTLNQLDKEGRIKFYNLGSCIQPKDNTPIIPTNYFSSEAVVNLLSLSGVTRIRTIGVDGGKNYSDNFKDLAEKTLLNNGHETFDIQFKSIARKIMMENLDYAPLDVPSPVKVYVGSMVEQILAVKVLEYSIKKVASLPVEVMPLFQSGIAIPMPNKPSNQPRTPFSFQRFIIPELNDNKGRAIYFDSDMQVFTDIKELWTKEMGEAEILSSYDASETGRRPQFSVMLINCEKLKWDIRDIVKKLDAEELTYEQLMYEMKLAQKIDPIIEREWNSLEHYEEGKTKLLHYTDMNKQPWLYCTNPLTSIWVRELFGAISCGYLSWRHLKKEVIEGNVRPSLWAQVKFRKFSKVPWYLKLLDLFFVPPHARQNSRAVKRFLNKTLAVIETTLLFWH